MNIDPLLVACALAVSCLTPVAARGQDPAPAEEPPTLDDTIDAGEALANDPPRRLVKWNEYEGPYYTIRVRGGFLYEGAWFAQDEESNEQFGIHNEEFGMNSSFSIMNSKFSELAGPSRRRVRLSTRRTSYEPG